MKSLNRFIIKLISARILRITCARLYAVRARTEMIAKALRVLEIGDEKYTHSAVSCVNVSASFSSDNTYDAKCLQGFTGTNEA